jgi:hypothetical protein
MRDRTVEKILEASHRRKKTVPIRNSFVQTRRKNEPVPGPLASLVRRGRDLTLEQYLLARAWASGGEFDLLKHPKVWGRALGLPDDIAARRLIQRNWTALAEMKLIHKERRGRLLKITILSEDGFGDPYRHPGSGAKDQRRRYIQLPFEYWSSGYYRTLTLPSKAVLLIGMTLGDWFWLPSRHAAAWYGISASTIERGLRELKRAGVLEARWIWKEQLLAPEPLAREHYYRLKPPFGPRGWFAKGAPDELKKLGSVKPTPPSQAGRSSRRSKRRTPAAKTA